MQQCSFNAILHGFPGLVDASLRDELDMGLIPAVMCELLRPVVLVSVSPILLVHGGRRTQVVCGF